MVLINGCSFVYGLGLEDRNDSYYVSTCRQMGWDYANIAVPGASNDLIRSSTITEVLANPGVYDRVLVGFTGLARLSLTTIDYRQPINLHLLTAGIYSNKDETKMHSVFWKKYYYHLYWIQNYAQNVYLIQQFCKAQGIECLCVNSTSPLDFDLWGTIYHKVNDGASPFEIVEIISNHKSAWIYSDEIKKLFDGSTDDVFIAVVKKVATMLHLIDYEKFAGLGQRHLQDRVAPWPIGNDGLHPGIEAHNYMTDIVLKKLNDLH